jgi:transcriptional regulator with XRE-family HTH domain
MDAFRTLLGARIKLLRKKLGMNQAQLAEAAGVEINTISRYETGAHAPSVEQLLNLASALQVSPIAILSTQEPGQQPITAADNPSSHQTFETSDQIVQTSIRMDVFRIILGSTIKQLRKNLDKTQAALAENIGVDINTISRYETGATAPSIEHLLNLSAALGVSPMELLPAQNSEAQRNMVIRQDINTKIVNIDCTQHLEEILLLVNSYSSLGEDTKK